MTTRFSHLDRQSQINRMKDVEFDLVVVGGGITGTGIALDAQRRGLRVALLEKEDWGAGTSSKSSKLVHGGLRYLEQMEFALVMESTAERALLMNHVSHLVRPLRFLFPVYKTGKHPAWFIQLGMWMYDLLALFRVHRRHERLGLQKMKGVEPLLSTEGLSAVMAYYDCITDDARLTLENAMAAHKVGTVALSRLTVLGLNRLSPDSLSLRVLDSEEGTEFEIRTRRVFNAAGPWTNEVLSREGMDSRSVVRPTKGVHLVVPASRLPLRNAVVVTSPRDGRVTFAIPWEDSTVLGTTDTDYQGSLDCVEATAEDVEYLLEAADSAFPEAALKSTDVKSVWAGLRPLIQDDSDNPYNTSREHEIYDHGDGIFTVAGGKLTTYRRMASECVDRVIASLGKVKTPSEKPPILFPFPGNEGFHYRADGEAAIDAAVSEFHVERDCAERLIERYGARWRAVLEGYGANGGTKRLAPGGRVLIAEAFYGIHCEMVGSLEDFLVRRTHLFFHLEDQGLAAARTLLKLLSEAGIWDEKKVEAEWTAYQKLVESNQRWKGDFPSQSNASAA